jgi:peroxiredoxin
MPTIKDALETGAAAPNFRLPSNLGDIALADYHGKRGVVLYFIREFACMSCQFHAAALVKAHPEIQAAEFEVLVIGGGSPSDAVRMAHRLHAPFPILADHDRSVYEQYNVDKALAFIQRSATFIVDAGGRIVYAHRSTHPSAGLNMKEVLEVIRKAK